MCKSFESSSLINPEATHLMPRFSERLAGLVRNFVESTFAAGLYAQVEEGRNLTFSFVNLSTFDFRLMSQRVTGNSTEMELACKIWLSC